MLWTFCFLHENFLVLYSFELPPTVTLMWCWKLLEKAKQERREWKFLPRLSGTSLMSSSLLFHYSKLITRNDNFQLVFLAAAYVVVFLIFVLSSYLREENAFQKKTSKRNIFHVFSAFFSDPMFVFQLNSRLDSQMYRNVVFLRPSLMSSYEKFPDIWNEPLKGRTKERKFMKIDPK